MSFPQCALSAMCSAGYELNEQLESIDICLDSLNRSMHGLQTQYPERRRLVLGLSARREFWF